MAFTEKTKGDILAKAQGIREYISSEIVNGYWNSTPNESNQRALQNSISEAIRKLEGLRRWVGE